ncbi:MAG: hypothetical protein ACRD1P_07845 [Thermoanaerobaculia bacterium]
MAITIARHAVATTATNASSSGRGGAAIPAAASSGRRQSGHFGTKGITSGAAALAILAIRLPALTISRLSS